MKYILVIKTEKNKKNEFNFYFYVFSYSKFDNCLYKADYAVADEDDYKRMLNSLVKKYNPLIAKL